MGLPYVKLPNGERIAYRSREGGEKVLVLVHGNMTSSKHWDVLMERIDPSFTIYAPDLRGFGESTYTSRITGIKDFSEDLSAFIEIIGLRTFDMIGWSTGGAVCMQYAADHPGKCRKIVLLASVSTRGHAFYGTDKDGKTDFNNRLQKLDDIEKDPRKTQFLQHLYDTKNREAIQAVWNTAVYTHNKPDADRYAEYIEDTLTQRNLADVYYALNMFNISAGHNGVAEGTNQAKKIDSPVLVLRGDRDYIITKQMTDEIMEDLGGQAVFVSLKNSGHSPLIDDADSAIREIESFLK